MSGKVYDPEGGYSQDALRISDDFAKVCEGVFEANPSLSLMELSGLLHSALEEARCSVSLKRRFNPPKVEA